MGNIYYKVRKPFQQVFPDELTAWYMKRNHLQQGFLILLIASLQASLLIWMFSSSDDSESRIYTPAFTVVDTSLTEPEGIFVRDSLLEGEEGWVEEAPQYEIDVTPILRSPLSRFFTALDKAQSKNGKVRIAYFGDSMIEGDLVTQSLRKDLQQQFGGKGVGFVPIFSEIPGFRKTIKHRIGNWKYFNYFKKIPSGLNLGISGELFLAAKPGALQQTWVRYKATDIYPGTEIFERVKLYYGQEANPNPDLKSFVIVDHDHGVDTFDLNQQNAVNELLISELPTEDISLHFHLSEQLPVFGLSVESDDGVFVDNFPSRSNSGTKLINIPGQILEGFSNHLHYDLVVLQFGLNVVSSNRKSFKNYEDGMKEVVEHFQEFMPETDILIVSVTDKSTRINGVLQTDPSVPLIVDAQRRVAEETQIGFLNLYEGMGGKNSMIRWVKSRPSLARRDYAHPNHRGAVKVFQHCEGFPPGKL